MPRADCDINATAENAGVDEGVDGNVFAAPLSEAMRQRVAALEEAFTEIAETRMAGLPVCNDALRVQAHGFRPWEEGRLLGALITPWFLNLIILPSDSDDWHAVRTGTEVEVVFPAGPCGFLHAHEERIGPYLSCSLFSPVFEFADQDMAVQAAEAALQALLGARRADARASRRDEEAAQEQQQDALHGKVPREMSRRGFLRAVLGGARTEDG